MRQKQVLSHSPPERWSGDGSRLLRVFAPAEAIGERCPTLLLGSAGRNPSGHLTQSNMHSAPTCIYPPLAAIVMVLAHLNRRGWRGWAARLRFRRRRGSVDLDFDVSAGRDDPEER